MKKLAMMSVLACLLDVSLMATGPTITSRPSTDHQPCRAVATDPWSFTVNWGAAIIGGKPWPKYVVEAKGCMLTMSDCRGDMVCSTHITCPWKTGRSTVWIEPAPHGTGSRATTGGASKPPVCTQAK
jgi:hypothetical protein